MRTQARLIQPVMRPAAVLVVMLAACCWLLVTPHAALASPFNQDVVTTTVTTTESVTETAAITDAVGNSVTPETVELPAPFYFIDGSTNQILRLEQDGVTRRAISHELQPVTAFDVAPDGSRLVYVAGNQLLEADASGLNRVVKVSGEAYDPADPAAAIARQIDNPVYSPDGSTIAFGLNGVNLIASGLDTNATPQLLLASSPYPEAGAPTDDGTLLRFFNPISWSPDGARLLVQFAYYPEAGGLALLDPASGALTELTTDSSDVPLIGDAAWKPDSTGFYIGSSLLAYGSPGLTYVDAATGAATGVLTTTAALDLGEANPIYLVRAPHVTAGNDALWAFVALQTDLQTLADYRLDSIDATNRTRTPLGEQVYAPDGDVLWARNDSGALLQTGVRVDANGVNGSLSWVPANGGDAVGLVASGRSPRWGSPDFSAPPPEAAEVVALFEQSLDLTAARANTETQAFPPSVAFPVIAPDGNTYWVAQTTGMRSFTPDVPHALGIYTREGDQWRELSVLQLVGTQEGVTAGPDYLDPNAVMPTTLDGKTLWLHVEGGAGAHGGVCEVVRFDGEQLIQELDSFSASPGACAIQDVNSDGAKEVVQDATDDYVFCYACGVKNINFTVQRWDGEQFVPMQLEPLTAAAPAQLNTINDELLRAVQGGLWKSALDLAAQQSITETDPSGVFGWNQALVRLTGAARRDYAENGDNPYPLLGYVFFGDYPAAVDVMRTVSATAIFTQPSALISGTVAEGWEAALSNVLTTTASAAIAVNPQLAAAYFVRGYGEWLADPTAQTATDDVRRAADLKPDDPLFAEAVTVLTGEARVPTAPLTDTATVTGAASVTTTTGVTNTAGVTATTATTTTTTGTAGATGRLFYSANSEGVDRIYALEFGTQNATLTELLTQGRQPALQPDGVRLAFQSTASDMLGLGGFDLDTGLRVNLTANLEDSLPRWNPADGQIAFSSTRYGDGRTRVYTVWPDGRTEAVDLGEGSDPDWSPDGTRLVYKGCDAQGANCGLWTMGRDGSDRRALTGNAGDARPRWSPDGSRVVFMSDQRDGNWDVYSVAVESGEVTRITFNPALDGIPAISPNGSEIVFLSNRGDRWGIWRVSIDSGRAQSIVGDVGALPNWLDESMDWVR